jgi:peptidyl-prolyl cis-trans isomerase C
MTKIRLAAVVVLLHALGAFAAQLDGIVFKGGDVAVKTSDIERYIEENTPPEPEEKAAMLNNPDIYREMAEMLYTIQILAAEAESMPDFDREQAEWTARIMYQRRIISDYRAKYVKQMLKDVNWDAMAEEEYKVNKQNYMTDEKVKASHILIKVNESRNDDSAKALAQELRERLLKGEDFAKLAKQYSEDPSAERNAGSLGFFKRGQMVQPFEEVAFAMQEPGELSEVVRTPFGYHIIMYHDRTAPEQIPFQSVKGKIVEQLQTQMGNKLWQDKLIAIRSSKEIIVDDKLLENLQQKYQTQKQKNSVL